MVPDMSTFPTLEQRRKKGLVDTRQGRSKVNSAVASPPWRPGRMVVSLAETKGLGIGEKGGAAQEVHRHMRPC
jgi:hypothetical protein